MQEDRDGGVSPLSPNSTEELTFDMSCLFTPGPWLAVAAIDYPLDYSHLPVTYNKDWQIVGTKRGHSSPVQSAATTLLDLPSDVFFVMFCDFPWSVVGKLRGLCRGLRHLFHDYETYWSYQYRKYLSNYGLGPRWSSYEEAVMEVGNMMINTTSLFTHDTNRFYSASTAEVTFACKLASYGLEIAAEKLGDLFGGGLSLEIILHSSRVPSHHVMSKLKPNSGYVMYMRDVRGPIAIDILEALLTLTQENVLPGSNLTQLVYELIYRIAQQKILGSLDDTALARMVELNTGTQEYFPDERANLLLYTHYDAVEIFRYFRVDRYDDDCYLYAAEVGATRILDYIKSVNDNQLLSNNKCFLDIISYAEHNMNDTTPAQLMGRLRPLLSLTWLRAHLRSSSGGFVYATQLLMLLPVLLETFTEMRADNSKFFDWLLNMICHYSFEHRRYHLQQIEARSASLSMLLQFGKDKYQNIIRKRLRYLRDVELINLYHQICYPGTPTWASHNIEQLIDKPWAAAWIEIETIVMPDPASPWPDPTEERWWCITKDEYVIVRGKDKTVFLHPPRSNFTLSKRDGEVWTIIRLGDTTPAFCANVYQLQPVA